MVVESRDSSKFGDYNYMQLISKNSFHKFMVDQFLKFQKIQTFRSHPPLTGWPASPSGLRPDSDDQISQRLAESVGDNKQMPA